MENFKINLSIEGYFAPKNQNLRVAANALCEVIQGKNMPQTTSMADARSYNRALALAAQLRADYVEMLIDVWSMSFGKEIDSNFLGKFVLEYESEHCSINDIWERGNLYNVIFAERQKKSRKQDVFELYVVADEGVIHLAVYKYSVEGEKYLDFEFSVDTDHDEIFWEVQEDEDNSRKFMSSAGVSVAELIESPTNALAKLRQEAAAVLAIIAEHQIR